MRTSFSAAQRADPRIEVADAVLRKCVHCGFCAPACPTYRLTGDELDGPRGRIWLIRDLLEGGTPDQGASPPADGDLVRHLDRCLGCLNCMPACPSGVDYHRLIGIARDVVEERTPRRPWDRLYRALLGRMLPVPGRFAALVRLARPFAALGPVIGGRIGAGLELARGARVAAGDEAAPGVYRPDGPVAGRVALITGCAQAVLAPEINGALVRVLNRAGIEAVVLAGAACCGALNEHLGQGEAARAHARTVIAAILAEADGGGLDAVVQTASGCGTLMKDYGAMFAADPKWSDRAARAAGLVRDAGEYLSALDLRFPDTSLARGRRIAWQAPCSLANWQRAAGFPAALLAHAGFEVVEPPEGPACCGSAGSYNLTEPGFAAALGERKAASLDALGAEAVASSNLGCMTQLAPRLSVPAVHVVQLIDWAQGGPVPARLKDIR